MHQAPTGEADHVGLLRAPAGQSRGPFLSTAQLVDLLTPLDHAAVDQPGDDRREFAGGDGEHGFVEQCEPCLPPALLDQEAALLVERQAEQIRLAKALPDTGRSHRGVVGGGGIAGRLLPHHHGHEQVSPLDAIARFPARPVAAPGRATPRHAPSLPGSAGACPPTTRSGRLGASRRPPDARDARAREPAGAHRRGRASTPMSRATRDPQLPAASPDRQSQATRARHAMLALRTPHARARGARMLGSWVSCGLARRHGDTLRIRLRRAVRGTVLTRRRACSAAAPRGAAPSPPRPGVSRSAPPHRARGAAARGLPRC